MRSNTPDPRLIAATATSKLLTRGIRVLGKGGGTALPGLVANRVDPNLLNKLAGRLPEGAIVVAGTNGKTTTSRMIAGMLERDGRKVVHNRSGSNLVRGISAAFAEQMTLLGTGGAEIGVIETDENAFPEVVRRAEPRVVVLLNLFRDQLDRYGELETIARHWQEPIRALPPSTVLIANADDPNLAALTKETEARIVLFGLRDAIYTLQQLPHASDASACRVCEHPLVYDSLFLSHLGDYHCPNCGNRRPRLDIAGSDIELLGMQRMRMTIRDDRNQDCVEPCEMRVDVALPGFYNAYNALAATTAARVLGLGNSAILDTLSSFEAAFGRLERLAYRGRWLTLALAKNPVGFNEVLRMIAAAPIVEPLVIAINDLDADGRDVSWLWDVDFEVLVEPQHTAPVFAAGLRGYDIAVRLKYAGVPSDRNDPRAVGMPLETALDRIVDATPEGSNVFVLLTYTAMLQLRQALVDRGAATDFWKQ